MTTIPERLKRAARAQASLATALELKLALVEVRLRALESDYREIVGLLNGTSTIALAFRNGALRRLVDTKIAMDHARGSLACIQRKVLLSRGRETSLSMRAEALEALLTRMAEQADMQDTLHLGRTKASHKQDVMD